MQSTIQTDGVRVAHELAEDVFYGFKIDAPTGNLNLEIIADGDGVIKLPFPDIIDSNDYKQWIWTTNTLEFRFATNGHLEMTVL